MHRLISRIITTDLEKGLKKFEDDVNKFLGDDWEPLGIEIDKQSETSLVCMAMLTKIEKCACQCDCCKSHDEFCTCECDCCLAHDHSRSRGEYES